MESEYDSRLMKICTVNKASYPCRFFFFASNRRNYCYAITKNIMMLTQLTSSFNELNKKPNGFLVHLYNTLSLDIICDCTEAVHREIKILMQIKDKNDTNSKFLYYQF